jgi:hypothetical protein
MGVGLLYKDLVKMEGARVTMKLGHKKKAITGIVRAVNLHKEGLYVMLELPNGEHKLLTPDDKVRDVTFKPQTPQEEETLESLAGDTSG